MLKQPGKFAGVGKTARAFGGEPEERRVLPEYMTEGITALLDSKDGGKTALYSLGLPVEDVRNLRPAEAVNLLSPIIKLPTELIANRHFFFEKPLSDVNYPPRGFKGAPNFIKEAVGYSEKTGTVDPKKWHIFSTLFGRFLWTSTATADTERDL